MRWLCFLCVLCGYGSCGWATASHNDTKARTKVLLVTNTIEDIEDKEQSIKTGFYFLKTFYKVGGEIEAKQVAQLELHDALAEKYDLVVLYAVGNLAKKRRDALKQHQLDGGGVIWFLQGNADLKFYRSLAGEMDQPLMPVLLDEYIEVTEEKAVSVIDCSLLPKELVARGLLFRGYWKIKAAENEERTINAVILSDGSPGVIYHEQSRTAVVLVNTQPALSNWVEEPSWVVFLEKLQSQLKPEPIDKNASDSRTD